MTIQRIKGLEIVPLSGYRAAYCFHPDIPDITLLDQFSWLILELIVSETNVEESFIENVSEKLDREQAKDVYRKSVFMLEEHGLLKH